MDKWTNSMGVLSRNISSSDRSNFCWKIKRKNRTTKINTIKCIGYRIGLYFRRYFTFTLGMDEFNCRVNWWGRDWYCICNSY